MKSITRIYVLLVHFRFLSNVITWTGYRFDSSIQPMQFSASRLQVGDVLSCRLAYSPFEHVMLIVSLINRQVLHVKGGGLFELVGHVRLEPLESVLQQTEMTNDCRISTSYHDQMLGSPLPLQLILNNVFENENETVSYNYLTSNCEHHVNRWRYNRSVSLQVLSVFQWIGPIQIIN